MQLAQYLSKQLTKEQWDNLPETFNVTPTRRTQMINRPESMTIDEIMKLAEILSMNLFDLVFQFNCGKDTISLTQAADLDLIDNHTPNTDGMEFKFKDCQIQLNKNFKYKSEFAGAIGKLKTPTFKTEFLSFMQVFIETVKA